LREPKKQIAGEGGVGGGQGVALPGPPPTLRLCVPIVEASSARARNLYMRAARKGFWAEVRLDYLEKPDLKRLFRTLPGPVVATNRLQAEGGRWTGSEADRLALLEEALTYGVQALDVEFRRGGLAPRAVRPAGSDPAHSLLARLHRHPGASPP
jgi:hypothetical protein